MLIRAEHGHVFNQPPVSRPFFKCVVRGGAIDLLLATERQLQKMAQQPLDDHRHFRSLMFNYVLFAALGLACSFLWNSYYNSSASDSMISQQLHIFSTQTQDLSLKDVKTVLQGTDCESVIAEAKLPDSLKDFMGSKLRHQFEPILKNETVIQHCRVTKVMADPPQLISIA